MKPFKNCPWFMCALVTCTGVLVPDGSCADQITIPETYRSRNFIIHTDLEKDDANALLKRLEERLRAIEKYWGHRSKRTIECYVANDVSTWDDSAFPNPYARLVISRIGGGSTEIVTGKGKSRKRRTVVYASAKSGIVDHEIVHAYCLQTFGATGPVWYKEGMAEIMNLGSERESAVRCPANYEDFFRNSETRTVDHVVKSGVFTNGIIDSLKQSRASTEAWTQKNIEAVDLARKSYRRAWALCFFLCHNSNYSKRFHSLGQSYMLKRSDSFSRAFSPVRQELDFEYAFYMKRFSIGYEVELCRWDWTTQFHEIKNGRSLSSKVIAKRGFQASRLLVSSGKRYTYHATGRWTTTKDEADTDAIGTDNGRGRLVGVVMNEFKLSEPFELGTDGTFTAPSDGKLYLRCQETWNALADNKGTITVRIERNR